MNQVLQSLLACPLFTGLTEAEMQEIVAQSRLTVRQYQRDQVVAFEDDECDTLGILAEGSIHIQRIFPSGKLITIETFTTGSSFGEALIFSQSNAYPATLIAKEDTTVIYIPRAAVIGFCTQFPRFLANFMSTLSDRILLLNRKIKNLSLGTVRQKVANFILEESHRQKQDEVSLTMTRYELADSLGIPRPSLSRELIAMKDAGWIDFNRKMVQVIDHAALEETLKS